VELTTDGRPLELTTDGRPLELTYDGPHASRAPSSPTTTTLKRGAVSV